MTTAGAPVRGWWRQVLLIVVVALAVTAVAGPVRASDPPVVRALDLYVSERAHDVTVEVEVSIDAPSQDPVQFDWATADGEGNTEGVDYEAAGGTVRLEPGETTATLSFVLLTDAVDESSGSMAIRATNGTNVAFPDGPEIVRIHTVDEHTPPEFDVENVLVAAESGAATVVVELWNGAVNPYEDLAFRWFTVDGTAIAGRDYVAAEGTVQVVDVETPLSIELLDAGDMAAPLTFEVHVEPLHGMTFRDDRASVVVQRQGEYVDINEFRGALLAGRAAQCDVPEYRFTMGFGDPFLLRGGPLDRLDAQLVLAGGSVPPTRDLFTRLRVVDGTAGLDNGDIAWDPDMIVRPSPDVAVGRTEAGQPEGGGIELFAGPELTGNPGNGWFDVVVEETSPDVRVTPERLRFWVVDERLPDVVLTNAPTGEIHVPDDVVREGDDVGSPVDVDVRLARPVEDDVSLDWRATTVVDEFVVTHDTGTVRIPAGATTARVRTHTVPDDYPESSSNLTVEIVGGNHVNWALAQARVTVVDDDTGPVIAPTSGGWRERQVVVEDQDVVRLPIGLVRGGGEAFDVTWATRDGSARSGSDYRTTSGTIRVSAAAGPGDVVGVMEIPLVRDGLPDDRVVETINIDLARGDGGPLGNPDDLIVHMVDADVSFEERDRTLAELACSWRERSPWTETATPPVAVLAGETRAGTSAAVSRYRFPVDQSVGTVVVASGLGDQEWADALAGAPLAAHLGAPLLLVTRDELPEQVRRELQRVLRPAGDVILLGGSAAIESSVEQQVRDMGYATRRIAGDDRVATSLAIAAALPTPENVLVATGSVFADALTAGAAASRHDGVVLLTRGEVGDPRIDQYLAGHRGGAFAIGGPAARAHPQTVPVMGATRHATSVAVAYRFFPEPTSVGLSRGDIAVDALASGPLLADVGAPLLLARSDRLPPSVDTWVCERHRQLRDGLVFGGSAAVRGATVTAFRDRLQGDCTTPPGETTVDVEDWSDRITPVGELDWEVPPAFRARPWIETSVAYTARPGPGDAVDVVATVCNRGVETLRADPFRKDDDPFSLGGVSFRKVPVRPVDAGAPAPRVVNEFLMIDGPDPALDGLQPGECATSIATWDGSLTDGAGPAGRAGPSRWQVSVYFELGTHGSRNVHGTVERS